MNDPTICQKLSSNKASVTSKIKLKYMQWFSSHKGLTANREKLTPRRESMFPPVKCGAHGSKNK